MQIANILIVIDHSKLMKSEYAKSSKDSPIVINEISNAHLPIYIFGKDGVITNFKENTTLKIIKISNQTIRWSLTTIDSNLECSPFLYDIESKSIITKKHEYKSEKRVYLNNLFIYETNHYHSIITEITINSNNCTCFKFQLINNETSLNIGFFEWNLNIIE